MDKGGNSMDWLNRFKRRFFGFLQNRLGNGYDAWSLFVAEMEIHDLREKLKSAESKMEVDDLRIKLRSEKDARIAIMKSMKEREKHSHEVAQLA